tara:strand:- start:1701 stop:2705 length:1005 start_codon:yes stop_codon:yes gene_type:complete
MNNTNYYYSLDFFRGFCGYGVAITHFYAFALDNLYMEYMSLIFAEFFFLLSGFVLYPQLLKVINNKKNLFIFFKRRWMRTLPLFLVVLVLISVLTNKLFSTDFFKYFFLVQKIVPNFLQDDYFPVLWHLSIEEFFYLVFPLIVICFHPSNFISKVIFIFLFITFIKFFIADMFSPNYYRTGTLLRFDAILLGFILAHYKNYLLIYKKFILSTLILLSPIYLLNYDLFISESSSPNLKFIFIIFMQILSGIIMFSFILSENFIEKTKMKSFSLLISQQAYSIYCFHMIFIYIFKELELISPIWSLIYLSLLFSISTLVYKYFEEPIMKLRPKIIN